MKVALDRKPNCIIDLTIELPPDRVAKEIGLVAGQFQKHARIPGYRPGKAPAAVIEKRYAREIEEEVRENLIGEAIRESAKKEGLKLHGVRDVPEAHIAEDKSMRIRATVVEIPQFTLPDYKSLSVSAPKRAVTDADVESFLEYLREPHSKFDPVAGRPLAMGDYAVASYEASVDGKPLAETAPKAPAQLKSRRNAWILMSEGTLFPGFAKAIEGMEPEQQRSFELDVPENFPVPELRGKKVAYSLTLHGINTKVPPALDDELANRIEPGSTLDSLRKKIRERHEESAEAQFKSAVRKAVIEKLLAGFACELPEDLVHLETKSIVKDIVMESQARGLSDEDIKEQTGKIVETAEGGAKDRVRANFLLLRIAEKEGLDASEAELHEALLDMSREYNIPLKKLVKDIGRSGSIGRIREQIRISKALDLAVANATVAATAEPSTPNT